MYSINLPEPFFVVTEPVHFSKGIDALVGVCRNVLNKEPIKEGSFIFHNRKRTQFIILFYDGDGFFMCKKRFSKGSLPKWSQSGEPFKIYDIRELFILLWRGTGNISFPDWWDK